jgi:hypothetical protein
VDEHMPAEQKRRRVRSAFGVPDFVDEDLVSLLIARRMLKVVPHEPRLPPDGTEPQPWTDTTLEPAIVHVEAFVSAYDGGGLDLALCGFGRVTGPTVAQVVRAEEDLATTAMGVVREQLPAGVAEVREWLVWLWSRLLADVGPPVHLD